MALPAAEHRAIRAQAKARRNEGRRRRRENPVALRWRDPQRHRCTGCGRWIRLGAEAGHGYGLTWCEACLLARELRLASRRLADDERRAALGGAAQPRQDQDDAREAQDDYHDAEPADDGHPAMVPAGGRRAA